MGATDYRGSAEGQYINKSGFHRYQSVLRNCRMVLTEKSGTADRFAGRPHKGKKNKRYSVFFG